MWQLKKNRALEEEKSFGATYWYRYVARQKPEATFLYVRTLPYWVPVHDAFYSKV